MLATYKKELVETQELLIALYLGNHIFSAPLNCCKSRICNNDNCKALAHWRLTIDLKFQPSLVLVWLLALRLQTDIGLVRSMPGKMCLHDLMLFLIYLKDVLFSFQPILHCCQIGLEWGHLLVGDRVWRYSIFSVLVVVLIFGTKFSWYQFQYLFSVPVLYHPKKIKIPGNSLVPEPIFSGTDIGTFLVFFFTNFGTFFRFQILLVPVPVPPKKNQKIRAFGTWNLWHLCHD